jgi:hypothetical protein
MEKTTENLAFKENDEKNNSELIAVKRLKQFGATKFGTRIIFYLVDEVLKGHEIRQKEVAKFFNCHDQTIRRAYHVLRRMGVFDLKLRHHQSPIITIDFEKFNRIIGGSI